MWPPVGLLKIISARADFDDHNHFSRNVFRAEFFRKL
jgi:hypothetical protein